MLPPPLKQSDADRLREIGAFVLEQSRASGSNVVPERQIEDLEEIALRIEGSIGALDT